MSRPVTTGGKADIIQYRGRLMGLLELLSSSRGVGVGRVSRSSFHSCPYEIQTYVQSYNTIMDPESVNLSPSKLEQSKSWPEIIFIDYHLDISTAETRTKTKTISYKYLHILGQFSMEEGWWKCPHFSMNRILNIMLRIVHRWFSSKVKI